MSTKFSEKQQYLICADYAENKNYSETARNFKTSDKTVKRIVKSNPEMAKIAEEKAIKNREKITEYMDSQAPRINSFINKFLTRLESDEVNGIELDKLAKVFGIVFDKFCRPAQEIKLDNEIKIVIDNPSLEAWSE